MNLYTHMLSATGCQDREEMMQVAVSMSGSDDMIGDIGHKNKLKIKRNIYIYCTQRRKKLN